MAPTAFQAYRPAVALHLLGRADLAARDAADYRARLDRLDAGEVDVLLAMREGAQHATGPPIGSLLSRCRRHGLEVERLVLVGTRLGATALEGREGNDTELLARLIADVLTRQPELYGAGHAPHARVVTVRELSAAAFQQAARRWLHHRGRADGKVVVTLGGGPVEGFLGLLMGCLEAGVVPLVCVTNQAIPDRDDLLELSVEGDAEPWLVRSGAFEAMAELQPTRRQEWLFLAALARYSWAEAERLRPGLPVGAERAMGLPRVLGEEPVDSTGWDFYRRLMEGVVARSVGAGDPSGLAAARAWPVIRVREVTSAGGEAEGRPKPWSARPHAGHVDHYVSAWRRGAVKPPEWLDELAPRARWAPAYEAARRLAHARPLTLERALAAATALAGQTTKPDPITRQLGHEGQLIAPLLPGPGRLIVACVSGPDLPRSSALQMLLAIQGCLSRAGRDVLAASHLRLVSSRESLPHAASMVAEASAALATAAVVGEVPPDDQEGCRRLVLGALRDAPELGGASAAVFACNPGTKAMNLGAVLAVLQWSFETLRPFSVAPLGLTPTGSELRLDPHARPVVARLLHDRVLRQLLPRLVRRLELPLARRLSSLGSDRWEPVTKRVDRLLRLWLERRPDGARWFPARAELCLRLAETDPWRALHTFCGLADQTWAAPVPGVGWAYPWRDGPGLLACQRVWTRRCEGPLGHHFLGGAGAPDEVAEEMRQAVRALRGAGLVPAEQEPSSRLAEEVARLVTEIEAVEILLRDAVDPREPLLPLAVPCPADGGEAL
jgi:hypothetical protein